MTLQELLALHHARYNPDRSVSVTEPIQEDLNPWGALHLGSLLLLAYVASRGVLGHEHRKIVLVGHSGEMLRVVQAGAVTAVAEALSGGVDPRTMVTRVTVYQGGYIPPEKDAFELRVALAVYTLRYMVSDNDT